MSRPKPRPRRGSSEVRGWHMTRLWVTRGPGLWGNWPTPRHALSKQRVKTQAIHFDQLGRPHERIFYTAPNSGDMDLKYAGSRPVPKRRPAEAAA